MEEERRKEDGEMRSRRRLNCCYWRKRWRPARAETEWVGEWLWRLALGARGDAEAHWRGRATGVRDLAFSSHFCRRCCCCRYCATAPLTTVQLNRRWQRSAAQRTLLNGQSQTQRARSLSPCIWRGTTVARCWAVVQRRPMTGCVRGTGTACHSLSTVSLNGGRAPSCASELLSLAAAPADGGSLEGTAPTGGGGGGAAISSRTHSHSLRCSLHSEIATSRKAEKYFGLGVSSFGKVECFLSFKNWSKKWRLGTVISSSGSLPLFLSSSSLICNRHQKSVPNWLIAQASSVVI